MITVEKKVILNDNDPDLVPIPVDILDLIQRTYKQYGLKPPQYLPRVDKIDNYGLPREEQIFKYTTYPQRLKLLEEGLRLEVKKDLKNASPAKREQEVVERFWDTLDVKRDEYQTEINWIKKQWYHRLFGYWFICDGVAKYMTGKNYFYLNYFEINAVGKPQYRDRDRRWWIGKQYAETETRTFAHRDKDGRVVKGTEHLMVETNRRVFLGIISAKARRVGDTSKSGCDIIEESTRTKEVLISMQSIDEVMGLNIFINHMSMPFKKLPIIFKPQYKRMNLREALRFDSDETENPLMTVVEYAESKFSKSLDGKTLHKYYADEAGKLEEELITLRHQTIRPALCEQGGLIHGTATYTTTVEDMSKNAGKVFLEFCKNSMWEQRIDNGQTKTGMLTLFFAGSDGAPEFIDKFGNSIIGTPTPEQAEHIGRDIGAEEYFIKQRALYSDEELAKIKRQIPLKFREVFTPPSKNVFFPVKKIESRLTELNFAKSKYYRRGQFTWTSGWGSHVQWVDQANGRFVLSTFLAPDETNRIVRIDGQFAPEFPDRYVLSADTFKLEKSTGNQMSDGGISVFRKRDPLIDIDGKDVSTWTTHNWVLSYRFRPATLESYLDDVLMAAIYFGAFVYPENNVDNVEAYFIEKNYSKMLLYSTDNSTGKPKNLAGFNSTVAIKQKLFNLMRDHLELHVNTCKDPFILNEVLDISGLDDMTKYDLFTAAAGCLLALESQQIQQAIERQSSTNDISGWLPEYAY